jgi:hypothetical protein
VWAPGRTSVCNLIWHSALAPALLPAASSPHHHNQHIYSFQVFFVVVFARLVAAGGTRKQSIYLARLASLSRRGTLAVQPEPALRANSSHPDLKKRFFTIVKVSNATPMRYPIASRRGIVSVQPVPGRRATFKVNKLKGKSYSF